MSHLVRVCVSAIIFFVLYAMRVVSKKSRRLVLPKNLFILWCVELLLGSDLETDNETTFVASRFLINTNRRPLLENGSVNTFQWQRIYMHQQSKC
jgi:hypothetical protein